MAGGDPNRVPGVGLQVRPHRPPGRRRTSWFIGLKVARNGGSWQGAAPDGREMYWTTVDTTAWTTRLVGTREIDGRWTDPAPPPFAADAEAGSPLFSPDGQRLYYAVRAGQRRETWFVERTAAGWSEPRRDDSPLDGSCSFTRSGRVYYSAPLATKVWGTGIFAARLDPDGFTDAAPLDTVINVPGAIDYTPFIAPDESFLLFASNRPRVGDREDMHVQVSFRAADGTWSTPRQVTDLAARFPALSPDGRYLFLCGDDGNMYWVGAGVVESLRGGGGGS